MSRLMVILAVLLALSLAGNAWLLNDRDKTLAREAATEQARKDTAAAAQACSDSVAGLANDSRKRHEAIMVSLGAQAGEVAGLKGAAIAALNSKPANPADLCGSLEAWLRAQIKTERAGR